MVNLMDLPMEILRQILEDPELYILDQVQINLQWDLKRQGCRPTHSSIVSAKNIRLLCRKANDIVRPTYWSNFQAYGWKNVQKLVPLLEYDKGPGHLIHDFEYIKRAVYGERSWTRHINEAFCRRGLDQDERHQVPILYQVLWSLTELRRLSLRCKISTMGYPDWISTLPLASLRALMLEHVILYPRTFQIICNLENLQYLSFDDNVSITPSGWKHKVLSCKSNVKYFSLNMEYFPAHRPGFREPKSNRVLREILWCFPAVIELELCAGPSSRKDYSLSRILNEFGKISHVEKFKLEHRGCRDHDLENGGQMLDLSAWDSLKVLDIDSITLWPRNGSWRVRGGLATRMPRSLERFKASTTPTEGIR